MTPITDVRLQNLGPAQVGAPVTFGQVFKAGDVSVSDILIGSLDGAALPLQTDIKATHADGSVRHAIVSAIVPRLAAGTAVLSLGKGGVLAEAVKTAWPDDFSVQVNLTIAGVVYRASAAQNDLRKWLEGAIVTENQCMMIFATDDGVKHPHLVARFAVRDYGSAQRVDVAVENNWAYAPGPQNFKYDVDILIGGKSVYAQAGLTHYVHARWRKVFWHGEAPQVHVQMNSSYWIATRAAPNYGTDAIPAESVLLDCDRFSKDAEPMRLGAGSVYMPETGGNGEIGLLPVWAWADILSQDVRARACTLGTGNCSGSYSMHYRDQQTDLPVALKDHPRMTLAGRSTDAGADAFPPPGGDTSSPYTPDIAHHPSLAYLPYLLTGDYYYLEEMQFWAMYCVFNSNPGYRGAEQGLLAPEQLRGQAWALRTLAQAAYATPDAHPLKSELLRVLDCNHDWYNANYTNNPNTNKIGVLTNGYSVAYDNDSMTATWMDDFFVQSLGHQVDLGFTKALLLLEWKSKFTLGRMLEVSFTIGAPYGLRIRDSSSTPVYDSIKQCYTSVLGEAFMALPWASLEMAEAWNKCLPASGGYPMNMYPSNGVYAGDMGNIAYGNMGYPSNMQPALAYLADYVFPEKSKAAWKLFMSRAVKCDYRTAGQFNIEPRDSDTVDVPPTQPPQGDKMTYKLSVVLAMAAQQLDAQSQAAPTTIRGEVLTADGQAVVASVDNGPFEFPGLAEGDYVFRASGLDSNAVVMGVPFQVAFTANDVTAPPGDPAPGGTIDVQLPSGAALTLTREQ